MTVTSYFYQRSRKSDRAELLRIKRKSRLSLPNAINSLVAWKPAITVIGNDSASCGIESVKFESHKGERQRSDYYLNQRYQQRQGKTGKERWKDICRTINADPYASPGRSPYPAAPVCPW
ncbi:hypothetical protein HZH68_014375 [Vespula germanica]|uniref:Uncharacterized protein n=1 Tax=Vespula germanica TaxID=30212 RepID=A0A834JA16_VESGE|nr:hypothetical protein HZH68_014375 [Vespula germanica]